MPPSTPPIAQASVKEARAAGLRYVSGEAPGIRREMRGGKVVYLSPRGARIKDTSSLRRIGALVIPPAWQKVWICPDPRGHLQAVGRDARGRRQYRYHARWREARDENKYHHMMAFARALPRIRRRVARDLKRPGMPREKVLAAVVRLLETTLIRVGNDEYARDNGSYGLTTLLHRQVRVRGDDIAFSFRGKSGRHHDIHVTDRRLTRIVRRCQDLPGQELFAYVTPDGRAHDIGSQDVNAYLREIAGDGYTAKDFRTWIGTVLAAIAFRELEAATSAAQAKKNVAAVIASVAAVLGNTPAVCRKCYVHPEIIAAYLQGIPPQALQAASQRVGENLRGALGHLRPIEAAVLSLLQRRLRQAARSAKALSA
jgi:DNA topoisomerase-1